VQLSSGWRKQSKWADRWCYVLTVLYCTLLQYFAGYSPAALMSCISGLGGREREWNGMGRGECMGKMGSEGINHVTFLRTTSHGGAWWSVMEFGGVQHSSGPPEWGQSGSMSLQWTSGPTADGALADGARPGCDGAPLYSANGRPEPWVTLLHAVQHVLVLYYTVRKAFQKQYCTVRTTPYGYG
jgi:hypothetical protein